MRKTLDPNALVNIPCPACGEKTAHTVASLGDSPRLRCPKCGVLMKVDARKIMQKIKEAEANVDSLQRRFNR
jgi:uncharacterized Zn finger protein